MPPEHYNPANWAVGGAEKPLPPYGVGKAFSLLHAHVCAADKDEAALLLGYHYNFLTLVQRERLGTWLDWRIHKGRNLANGTRRQLRHLLDVHRLVFTSNQSRPVPSDGPVSTDEWSGETDTTADVPPTRFELVKELMRCTTP